jgi:hypothetical protein
LRAIRAAYADRLRRAYTELSASGKVLCDVAVAVDVAQGGGLLLDPASELPSRIDFIHVPADAVGGGDSETVEVRSPADDAPESTEPVEGERFVLRVGPGRWDALRVEVDLAVAAGEGAQRDLRELVRAWFLCGYFGGYGGEGRGVLHSMARLEVDAQRAILEVDLGSASLRAIESLVDLLEGFAAEVVPVREVRLGRAGS